eukprot:366571-Chlamydomonas_euryale.AAC.28
MQPAAVGDVAARLPLNVPGTSKTIAWVSQARNLVLMTAGGTVAEPPPAQAPGGGEEGLQRPTVRIAAPRQHAHASHRVPRLCRPGASLRSVGD